MAFTRRIFTKEFRLNAAKLVVDEHRPAVDVARELDINPKSLYSWVRQYRSGLLQASLTAKIPLVPSRQRLRVCAPNCRSPAPRYCC